MSPKRCHKFKYSQAAMFQRYFYRVCLYLKFAFHFVIGVPEGGGRRALAWRILLGYLPSQRNSWVDVCREKRTLYSQLVSEMIVTSPEEKSPDIEDHPLNLNPTSQWQSYFRDNEVLLQIDKDVRRLCPDLTFFQQATPHPNPIIGDKCQEKLYTRSVLDLL